MKSCIPWCLSSFDVLNKFQAQRLLSQLLDFQTLSLCKFACLTFPVFTLRNTTTMSLDTITLNFQKHKGFIPPESNDQENSFDSTQCC